MSTTIQLDEFTRAYIEAALWSSTDDDGTPLDSGRDWTGVAPEALEKIIADCAKFQAENDATIADAECSRGSGEYSKWEQAGHDFWLTRNGHGAGFWDGDWDEPAATVLDNASKAFGECDLYVGDDGLVYVL